MWSTSWHKVQKVAPYGLIWPSMVEACNPGWIVFQRTTLSAAACWQKARSAAGERTKQKLSAHRTVWADAAVVVKAGELTYMDGETTGAAWVLLVTATDVRR